LPNASQTFTLTVDAAPAFTSVNSTSFTESSAGTFTVIASGYPVPTISAGTLPSWLSFNATTGILSGTPPTGSSTNSPYTITFTAGNGIGSNATQSFSLTVSAYTAPTANVSGTVFLSDGVTPLSGVTVALSGTALSSPLTATTGSNGNFTIANVPDANIYTVTLSPPTAASSSAFYPASSSISGTTNGAFTITTNSAPPAGSGAALTGINFTAAVGYAVSGSVTYTSRQLGGFNKTIMYVTLQNTNCSTCAPQLGTSTSAVNGGTFNIDGVPPGTYILNTWADQGGLGVPNAFYSSGTTASFTVPAVTTAPVTLQTPGTAPVTTAPTMVVTPMESGVIVHYQPVMSAGVEQPLYYVLQWDQSQSTCKTDPNGPNGLASTTGYYSGNVPAGSGNIVILDSNVSGNPAVVGDPGSNITPPNFADGTALYVCMAAVESDGLTLGPWSSQQVTIGALGGSNFSSLGLNVTIPATPTLPTDNPVDLGTAPLYAGCLDENTGNIYMNSMFGVAGDPTATAGTTNNESVNVPNGAYCTTFAFVDINEDGLITPEGKNAAHVDFGPDIYNINQNVAPVSVTTSSVQNIDLTPAVENGLATVRTQSVQSMDQGGNLTSQSYNLIFDVHAQRDLPVEVELQGLTPLMGYTGPDVLQPLNLAVCTSCYSPSELGAQNDFNLTVSTAGMPPRIGDTYNLLVTYLNQTNEVTLSPAVTGVSSAFATGLTVTASSTPTFTWTYPANASSYTYQFTLTDATGKVLWQVPAANAMSNSFSSSVSASIVLGTDPLGGTNTGPSSLAAGTYQWSISAIDSNGNVDINGNIDSAGNIATVQQTFTP
jgi:hypothetical protein